MQRRRPSPIEQLHGGRRRSVSSSSSSSFLSPSETTSPFDFRFRGTYAILCAGNIVVVAGDQQATIEDGRRDAEHGGGGGGGGGASAKFPPHSLTGPTRTPPPRLEASAGRDAPPVSGRPPSVRLSCLMRVMNRRSPSSQSHNGRSFYNLFSRASTPLRPSALIHCLICRTLSLDPAGDLDERGGGVIRLFVAWRPPSI